MNYVEELIRPALGGWSALVLIIVSVMIWAIKSRPGWLRSDTKSPRGSATSERYWRARLAEALAQFDGALPDSERDQLAARVTGARIMVEAHEAKRRLRLGGVWPSWVLLVVFMLAASAVWPIALRSGSIIVWAFAVALTALTFGCEVLALTASAEIARRVEVLAAAGREGHSDLVRTDPWQVMRDYDAWVVRSGRKRVERDLAAHRTATIPFRRRFISDHVGLRAWPDGIPVGLDIWSTCCDTRRPLPQLMSGTLRVRDAEAAASAAGT